MMKDIREILWEYRRIRSVKL